MCEFQLLILQESKFRHWGKKITISHAETVRTCWLLFYSLYCTWHLSDRIWKTYSPNLSSPTLCHQVEPCWRKEQNMFNLQSLSWKNLNVNKSLKLFQQQHWTRLFLHHFHPHHSFSGKNCSLNVLFLVLRGSFSQDHILILCIFQISKM